MKCVLDGMCAYHVEVQGVTCVAVWEIVAAVSFIQRRTRGGRGGRGEEGLSVAFIVSFVALCIYQMGTCFVNFMIYLIMRQLLCILVPLITHKVGMTSIPALV